MLNCIVFVSDSLIQNLCENTSQSKNGVDNFPW